MSENSAHDDLAYIRSIAEEGRNVPLVGSLSYLIWGSIIGTTALISFLSDTGLLPHIPALWLWTGAILLGWALSILTGKRLASKPGASTLANRTVGMAWFGCGLFVTIYWLTLIAAMYLPGPSSFPIFYLFATMFPVAFGLYGLAFFVTAVIANLTWYRWIAFAAWGVASLLLLVLAFAPGYQLLVAAIGTYAVVLVPGIIMRRHEPSDIV